mmetsp:Transcript_17063/g.47256  ORF Transcript_17063/g.47256 Transcript_17063/m.47256 type:complete len:281 (-) Transcript_17063:418-1260(-)
MSGYRNKAGCPSISDGFLISPLNRQRPIKSSAPVHVLPGCSLTAGAAGACICSLIFYVLPLGCVEGEGDAHSLHHLHLLCGEVSIQVHTLGLGLLLLSSLCIPHLLVTLASLISLLAVLPPPAFIPPVAFCTLLAAAAFPGIAVPLLSVFMPAGCPLLVPVSPPVLVPAPLPVAITVFVPVFLALPVLVSPPVAITLALPVSVSVLALVFAAPLLSIPVPVSFSLPVWNFPVPAVGLLITTHAALRRCCPCCYHCPSSNKLVDGLCWAAAVLLVLLCKAS